MRTTLNLDDEVYRRLKEHAARAGKPMSEIVAEALRMLLLSPETAPRKFRLRWNVVRGRLLPGVDVNDRDSLYERMEGNG